jgi:hypothetical protein
MASPAGKSREQQARFGDDVIEEPPNSTVDDWLGQRVERDAQRADDAMEEAGGDEGRAEQLYDEGSD